MAATIRGRDRSVKEIDVANATCSIPDCGRRAWTRGWCQSHYARWREDGDPLSRPVTRFRTGCSVDGCSAKHWGNGYCQTHAYRFRENGDPLATRPPGGAAGDTHFNWRGDDIRYPAVHRRLREFCGKATSHTCVDCGEQAKDWAYNHQAEVEFTDPDLGLAYSTNLDDYQPMCRRCHFYFDQVMPRLGGLAGR